MAVALNTPRAFFTNKIGTEPLSYGRVSFYEAGTAELKEIYANQQETENLTNPLRLDIGGKVPSAGAWLGYGYYKIKVEKFIGKDELGNDEFALEYTIDDYLGVGQSVDEIVKENIVIEKVTDLREIAISNEIVYCLGYYASNDGGGGWFQYDSTSTKADDGGAYIAPTGNPATGRYLRIFNNGVNIRMWGAVEGQANVATNIKNASIYCARDETRTSETLLFPAGQYAIADTELLLDDSRDSNKVGYVIEESCEFIQDSGTNTIRFKNPTLIHGRTKIADRLEVAESVLGFVYSEWWGVGVDIPTSIAISFNNCINGSNNQPIRLLSGTYNFGGTNVVVNNKLIFEEGAKINGGSSSNITIKTIENNSTQSILDNNISNVILTDRQIPTSYFNLDNVTDLTNILACAANSGFTLVWEKSFTFDADFAFNGTIINKFIGGVTWSLGGNNITGVYAEIPQYETFVLGGGNIELANYTSYDSIWFNSSTIANINQFISNAILYEKNMRFFGNISSDTPLDFALGSGRNLIVRDLKLTGITVANTITTSGQSELTFKDSEFIQFNTASGILIADNGITFDNCSIYNGYTQFYSSFGKTAIKNSILENNIIFTNCSNAYVSIVNNVFFDCRILLQSVGTTMNKTTISNNDFTEVSETNYINANHFIGISPQAGQTSVVIEDLSVSNNTYSAFDGIPTDWYIYNIEDLSTISNSWADTGNRISVENEVANELARKRETAGVSSILVFATIAGVNATIQTDTLLDTAFTGPFVLNTGAIGWINFSGINASFEDEVDKIASKPILCNISFNNLLDNYELNIYCPLGTPFLVPGGNNYIIRMTFNQIFS